MGAANSRPSGGTGSGPGGGSSGPIIPIASGKFDAQIKKTGRLDLRFRGIAPGDDLSSVAHLVLVIDVSHNVIPRLPLDICQLTGLRELIARDCSLEEIPDQIFDLPNLQILNVSSNCLQSLPSGIGRARRLTTLDVSYNRALTRLPRELGHCQFLTTVRFTGCRLSPQMRTYMELYGLSELLEYFRNPTNPSYRTKYSRAGRAVVATDGMVAETLRSPDALLALEQVCVTWRITTDPEHPSGKFIQEFPLTISPSRFQRNRFAEDFQRACLEVIRANDLLGPEILNNPSVVFYCRNLEKGDKPNKKDCIRMPIANYDFVVRVQKQYRVYFDVYVPPEFIPRSMRTLESSSSSPTALLK